MVPHKSTRFPGVVAVPEIVNCAATMFTLRLGASWQESVSLIILRLVESGHDQKFLYEWENLKKLKRKLHDKIHFRAAPKLPIAAKESTLKKLGLEHFYSSFMFWSSMLGIATVFAIAECCKRKPKNDNVQSIMEGNVIQVAPENKKNPFWIEVDPIKRKKIIIWRALRTL